MASLCLTTYALSLRAFLPGCFLQQLEHDLSPSESVLKLTPLYDARIKTLSEVTGTQLSGTLSVSCHGNLASTPYSASMKASAI